MSEIIEPEAEKSIQAFTDRNRITGLPTVFYYIPNFITEQEEASLKQKILSAPKPKWTVLSRRRLQTYPSQLSKSNALLAEPLPGWLDDVVQKMVELGVWNDSPHARANHVLINEYEAGQGISPHKDGAAYHPIVATVSLGSHTVLDIWEQREDGTRGEEPKWRILQEPRSLLITTSDAYRDYQHGIAEIETDDNLDEASIANWSLLGQPDQFQGSAARTIRLSLTFRDVLKVVAIPKGLKFGLKR